MADHNPFDDGGPYYESGDSFQEFTDGRSPVGRPWANSPLVTTESADSPLIEFICGGDDDSVDPAPTQ